MLGHPEEDDEADMTMQRPDARTGRKPLF